MFRITNFVFLFVTLTNCSTGNAQLADLDLLHDFYDRRGTPITAGQVVQLSQKEVVVKDGWNSEIAIQISKLSKRDQSFIRILNSKKNSEQSRVENAHELIEKLKSGSSKLKIKRLTELSELGSSATHCANQVLLIAKNSEDKELRNSAFYCFLSICSANQEAFDQLISVLREDRFIYNYAKSNPATFLLGIPKFGSGSGAEKISINAAFTGIVLFDHSNIALTPKSKVFATTDGKQNQIRSYALLSLAKFRNSRATTAIWATIQAAETKVNGQYDKNTIRNLLTYWGDPRQQCPNRGVLKYAEFGTRYKEIFPKEVEAWELNSEKWVGVAKERSRIIKLSKMRNFHDRQGLFITRGNLVNVDQGKVIISNYQNKNILFDLSRLSNKDQAWIESQARN